MTRLVLLATAAAVVPAVAGPAAASDCVGTRYHRVCRTDSGYCLVWDPPPYLCVEVER